MNTRRLYYTNQVGKHGTDRFNCWGATMFVLEAIDNLEWIGDYKIMAFLEEKTVVVDQGERKRGDIFVMYLWGIEHTAIYLGRGKFFHKKGQNVSEITDIRGIFSTYRASKIEYRRMK